MREALQDVVALVIEYTAGPLDRALEDLELEQYRAAQQAADTACQSERLAQVRLLQRNRDRVAPCLLELLEHELAALRSPPVSHAAQAPTAAAGSGVEWRLLEDHEAHDDALLRTISARYEARAGLALQLLGQRFGVLGARPAFDAEQLPVGPHRLTMHVADACGRLGLDGALRRRLLELFEQRVLAHYEEFADAMNDALARRGVLPGMSFVPIRMQPRARRVDDETPSAATSGAAPFDLLRSLLARRRAAIARFRAPGPGQDDAPDAWRSASLPGFGDAAGAGANPAEADAAADVRELVELWYARILREVRAGSPSASWLEALRPAVVQAALHDPRVFDRRDHPVRRLLDAIVEAGEPGADGDADAALQDALARAVDEAVASGGEPRAFERANASVQDARRAAARRAEVAERRLVDAARGRERLAEARMRTSAAITGLMRGRELPFFARTLVQQAWADVLTLTALRTGADDGDWSRQIDTTRQIIEVALGAAPEPDLAARIREALTAIGTHEDEAAMIAAHLGAGPPADEGNAASRTELLVRLKARARLGAEALPGPVGTAPLTLAERERFAALPVGEADAWFEFAGAHDGDPPTRRRLVWAGPATNTALFVNRRGQRAAEIGLDALARDLDTGRIRAIGPDSRGGVERAWDAMLAALRGFDPDRERPHA